MSICSSGFVYGNDSAFWIPYNTASMGIAARINISTSFTEVLIYLYRNDSPEPFAKFSLVSKPDHIDLVADPVNPLRWQIVLPFESYAGKIQNGDRITAVVATDTNDTIEFGPNGKNTISSYDLGEVYCFPNDITLEINQ